MLIVMFFGLTGCSTFFEPPPAAFERWTKPGTSSYQVMASLMECGYPAPSATILEWISAEGTTWEASRLQATRCMEAQEYSQRYGEGFKHECKYYSHAETRKYFKAEQLEALDRACAPDTPVRQPSVEKRLNNPYCTRKAYREYPQCQPIVPPDLKSEIRAPSRPRILPEYPMPNELEERVQKENTDRMNKMRETMRKTK